MKKALLATAFVMLAGAAIPAAHAEDNRIELSMAEILSSPEAREAGLDGSVKFFLAGASPRSAQRMGDAVANKKSNAFGRPPETACQRAMLSALREFQESAKRRHANAVVDMVSFYKRHEEPSASNYVCYAGHLIAAVTMKGTYATVR